MNAKTRSPATPSLPVAATSKTREASISAWIVVESSVVEDIGLLRSASMYSMPLCSKASGAGAISTHRVVAEASQSRKEASCVTQGGRQPNELDPPADGVVPSP